MADAGDASSKATITLTREAEAGSAEKDREENRRSHHAKTSSHSSREKTELSPEMPKDETTSKFFEKLVYLTLCVGLFWPIAVRTKPKECRSDVAGFFDGAPRQETERI